MEWMNWRRNGTLETRLRQQVHAKELKNRNLEMETIPIIVGALLGSIRHSMEKNSKKILENLKQEKETVQEIALEERRFRRIEEKKTPYRRTHSKKEELKRRRHRTGDRTGRKKISKNSREEDAVQETALEERRFQEKKTPYRRSHDVGRPTLFGNGTNGIPASTLGGNGRRRRGLQLRRIEVFAPTERRTPGIRRRSGRKG